MPFGRSKLQSESQTMALCCLVFFCILTFSAGSEIIFTSTPQVISNGLTRNLTLRCSLRDTGTKVPNMMGNYNDYKQTTENAKHISSIIITKGGNIYVADINTFSKVNGNNDSSITLLAGNVAQKCDEIGYLKIVWNAPTALLSDTYKCQIAAMFSRGRSVLYATTNTVGVSPPSVGEMAARITELDQAVADIKRMHQAPRKTNDVASHMTTKDMEALVNRLISERINKW